MFLFMFTPLAFADDCDEPRGLNPGLIPTTVDPGRVMFELGLGATELGVSGVEVGGLETRVGVLPRMDLRLATPGLVHGKGWSGAGEGALGVGVNLIGNDSGMLAVGVHYYGVFDTSGEAFTLAEVASVAGTTWAVGFDGGAGLGGWVEMALPHADPWVASETTIGGNFAFPIGNLWGVTLETATTIPALSPKSSETAGAVILTLALGDSAQLDAGVERPIQREGSAAVFWALSWRS